MNPLRIARQLREDYLTLLRTTFSPRQARLREEFNNQIEREGFLTREPFISLSQPYQHAAALDGLLAETRSRFGHIAECPYAHQAEAVQRIAQDLPTVIATGTGSGKTEAFLIPIVDHCLRHRGEPGLKAIIVYPMNALANDQLRRVRELLGGSGVSYGRYTGETQLRGQRPADAPEEERVTRTEFRNNPPDIILTNYQMLDYMLLRGDGRDIFRGHRVKFIVLDEVHTYHGALGTDVACLLRRLRASLSSGASDNVSPLFIGTSATLQSGEEGEDPRSGVAAFFSQLTSQETSPEAVIIERFDPPKIPEGLSLLPAPGITEEELEQFDAENWDMVLSLARRLAGADKQDSRTLEELWESSLLPYLLFQWLERPLSLSEIVQKLSEQAGREGLGTDQLRREIEAALLVGPCLPDSHPLRLRPRVHRFLRGLARFWRCTNPDCGQLLDEGVGSCSSCGSRSLPLAICRTCGWDFFVGVTDGEGSVSPWLERGSSRNTLFLYDPPTARIDVDEEDNPLEDAEEEGETETEEDEDVREGTETVLEAEAYLCPQCLSLSESPAARLCTCDDSARLRPVRLHRGRGTRCPVCRSRYGRFDVLTPVSLGNSSALTHISRTLLRELPRGKEKLLVFCDSRQDAAHQARFIEGVEGHLRLRRAVYRSLSDSDRAHDLQYLVDEVYNRFVEEGFLPRTRTQDAMNRAKDQIEGGILQEFVLAANVRASLERLGLVGVKYAGLEEELEKESFRELCASHGLNLDDAQIAVLRLLDFMRGRFAIDHEAFRTRLHRNHPLSQRFGLTPGRQVGLPVAFQRPGVRSQGTATYKLMSTWNTSGAPAGLQRLWMQILDGGASADSVEVVLRWLDEEGWLVWSRIGRDANEAEGYQIITGTLEFAAATRSLQCGVCGRIAPNDRAGSPCPRAGCEGRLVEWEGTIAEGNLNALLISAEHAPPLRPAEHTAAVLDETRQQVEAGFQTDPPLYNVLVCTPTLELGVNIGDLEGVAMRNIPPSPANYAQRAGRAGRESRMGMVVGFARNTPHDGYFFDHPDEAITGAILPPRFNIANLEAIARHVRSLVLEEARIEFPANLTTLISEQGNLNAETVGNFVQQISEAQDRSLERARAVFVPQIAGLRDDWENWLPNVIADFAEQVRTTIEQRASLIENAFGRMTEIATKKAHQTQREHDAEHGYRNLAVKLREDYRYAYLPRVLAEAGLLPGYAFPGDPGTISLGYDPEPIFAGRLQAQREYAPGQVVYARGHRWKVGGLALNRPGAMNLTRGAERFEYTECPACGLANPATGANHCIRCSAELSGPNKTAWDCGAFQAWPAEIEPETEEERLFGSFDVRVHPQRNVASRNFGLGPWAFELRSQEEIWWINHGPQPPPLGRRDVQPAAAFLLCPLCGEQISPPAAQPVTPAGRRRRNRDSRAGRDAHRDRCGGTPADFALGHQVQADTLRLHAPGLAESGDEGLSAAWSLAWAVVHGAMRLFDLDEDDVLPHVLTRRIENLQEVMEIIWVDSVLGGSGILSEVVRRFPSVAASAVEHLQGHTCPDSCYRCLRTYRNQRVHRFLDWRTVLPQLVAAREESVVDMGESPVPRATTEGPEWDEARREACGSPLELRLLLEIRSAGLPEPEKQLRIEDDREKLLTVADFAYPTQRLLIYVDGLAFHSSVRQRVHDADQTNKLQIMGYRVLRFVGRQVYRSIADCVNLIRTALAEPGGSA